MLPMGLSSATTVRVSNALGAGLPRDAQRSAHTAAGLALGVQLALTTGVVLSRHWLGYLFTNVPEVRSLLVYE